MAAFPFACRTENTGPPRENSFSRGSLIDEKGPFGYNMVDFFTKGEGYVQDFHSPGGAVYARGRH